MLLHSLKVFLAVATEKSFSRAAEKLMRTQPAVSLAVQRLEAELNEKLIDRSAKELLLTDAGRIVVDYARRFQNLEGELQNALDLGLEAKRDQASAHKHLAFINCVTGREKKCRSEFNKALDADPKFDLEPAEAGHPVWGQVLRSIKAERAARAERAAKAEGAAKTKSK